jgi:tetratricopeptide (TPR) repeat protein
MRIGKAISLSLLVQIGVAAGCSRGKEKPETSNRSDTARSLALLDSSQKYYPSDNNKSVVYAYMALMAAEKDQYKRGIGKARFQLSTIGYYKGDYKGALSNITLSHRIFTGLKDTAEISRCLNILGVLNVKLLRYQEALDYYYKAAELNEKARRYAQLCLNLQNIGNVFYYQGDYAKAESYYRQGLQIAVKQKLEKNKINLYLNLGSLFAAHERNDSALYYYEKVNSTLERTRSDEYSRTGVLNNLGHLYRNMGNMEKARNYLTRSLEVSKKLHIRENQLESIKQLAQLNYSDGNFSAARSFAEEVIRLTAGSDFAEPQVLAYDILYKVSKRENNPLLALSYYEKKTEIDDSISNTQNLEDLRKMDMKYQTERLNQENRILQEQNNTYKAQQRTIYLALALTVILLVFVIIVLYLRQLTAKQKSLLVIKEKQILENEKHLMESKLSQKQNELLAVSTLQISTNESLLQIILRLRQIANLEKGNSAVSEELNMIAGSIEHIAKIDAWENFRNRFIEIHPRFFENLNKVCPELTNNDLKIASLIRMNLNTKEIAAITLKSVESIHVARYRLRKKLGTEEDKLFNILLSVPGS